MSRATVDVQETVVMIVILSHVSKPCAKYRRWIINTSISRGTTVQKLTNNLETLSTWSADTHP